MTKRILLIDDEKEILPLYQQELAKEGYDIVTASDEPEALDHLKSEGADVVIVDPDIQRGAGIEYLQDIVGVGRNTRIIINTTNSMYKWDFNTWAADAFVDKSRDLSQLKRAIQGCLKQN